MSTDNKKKSKLVGLLSFLLVIALGVSLAKLMWLVLTPAQKIQTQTTQVNDVSTTPVTNINYGSVIAKQHLFGVVKKAKVPVKTKVVATKTTQPRKKLDLKLHGVVSYKNNHEGYALISSSGGSQKVYGKGDELEKDVSIKDIFSNKVVILNNGLEEELVLPRKEASNKSSRSSLPPVALPGAEVSRRPKRNNNTDNGAPDLSQFREEVLANPRKLMDIATPSPAIVNGKFIGFRVHPGARRKTFRELGFRPNDIITEVNGIVLDDASKGAQVLADLTQASQLSVKVKRGTQELFIDHSF